MPRNRWSNQWPQGPDAIRLAPMEQVAKRLRVRISTARSLWHSAIVKLNDDPRAIYYLCMALRIKRQMTNPPDHMELVVARSAECNREFVDRWRVDMEGL
jgi:hypothetical protein